MVAHLESIQTKCSELRKDPDCLDGVLRDGAICANSFASKTLCSAKVAIVFTRRT